MNIIEPGLVRVANSKDFEAVLKLLRSENLPVEDISEQLSHFFVIDDKRKVVAVIGLEIYGKHGLLRNDCGP
jgi:N-acetylglutamate synthase-like GNAT family acetyltransferase